MKLEYLILNAHTMDQLTLDKESKDNILDSITPQEIIKQIIKSSFKDNFENDLQNLIMERQFQF